VLDASRAVIVQNGSQAHDMEERLVTFSIFVWRVRATAPVSAGSLHRSFGTHKITWGSEFYAAHLRTTRNLPGLISDNRPDDALFPKEIILHVRE
jgi:hypothetical protein